MIPLFLAASGRAFNLNNTLVQLRKTCNHPFLFRDDEYNLDRTLVEHSGKLAVLDALLPRLLVTRHRCLVFFQYTRVMDIVEEYLDWRGVDFFRLDGTTKGEDRAAMIDAFNASACQAHVFLLSTRAGGLGLNLQSSDTVVMFDLDFNPQVCAFVVFAHDADNGKTSCFHLFFLIQFSVSSG